MLTQNLHRCLITVTMCLPLVFRTDEEYERLFLRLCMDIYDTLVFDGHDVNFVGSLRGDDGPAFFISIDGDALLVKKLCIEFEEGVPGGRLLDIDVMDEEGTNISRGDIGLPPRKCFLCDNPAAQCVSRRLHSPEEIGAWVKEMKGNIEV